MTDGIKGTLEVMDDGSIKVDHCGGYLFFVPPTEGPGTYADVRRRIETMKLGRPTMGEGASLIYACMQNQSEIFAKEFLEKMKTPFWVSTIRYETPQGVYAIDHPEVNESGEIMIPQNLRINRGDLASRTREDDRVHYNSAVYNGDDIVRMENSIRLTASESLVENILSSQLHESRIIRAEAGRQGLLKLAEVAKKQHNMVFVGGKNNLQVERTVKIPALYFSNDGRLVIAGDDYNSDRGDGWCIGIDRNKSNIKPDSPLLID